MARWARKLPGLSSASAPAMTRARHRREVTSILREQAGRRVLRVPRLRIVGELPRRKELHVVVARVGYHAPERRPRLALERGRRADRLDAAVRDGREVERAARVEQRGAERGNVLLVDVRAGDHGARRPPVGADVIPAHRAALPLERRLLLPVLAAGDVEVGAHAVAAARATAREQHATISIRTTLEARFQAGCQRSGTREHVHDATDRIASVERGARALEDLDPGGLRDVDLVQRVVIEEASRARRDAVLEVEVHRLRGDRLAHRHAVPLARQLGDVHAGDPIHDARGVRGMRATKLGAVHDVDRRRGFIATAELAGGADRHRRQQRRRGGEGDIERRVLCVADGER